MPVLNFLKKDILFIIGDWNAKVGSQETPGATGKFGLGIRNEARQENALCQENALVITNTLFQHTREDSIHGHHQMVNTEIRLIVFFAAKIWRSSIQSTKTRPRADCGSDHELLPYCQIQIKLKKVGKTTGPFRYDLNQIPYDYTVEVRNRFKGLGLMECLMSYGMRFVTLYRRQGSRPSPWKRNAKKQNGCLGRPYK